MIKVAWLCAFSNAELRSHLTYPRWHWANLLRRLLGMDRQMDYAVWDTYAIQAFEEIAPPNIELHIIVPHFGISHTQEFTSKGIHYHIFWSEWDVILEKIKRRLNMRKEKAFKNHRRTIKRIIDSIHPDLVHIIGIENKFYSMAALDLPAGTPIISQLQTLVNDDLFKTSRGATEKEYAYDSEMEKLVILRSDFIGTEVMRYRDIIKRKIKENVVFVDTTLALTEPVKDEETTKEYDFVYFAADISKAVDLAIEAFAEAKKTHHELTLDVIGGFSSVYKEQLDRRIKELQIEEGIKFEGKLPTHDDVIHQIRKSRYALLPLKVDIVSGTIREAMACGLPVITTITPGTPFLNEKTECVLLSETGDHSAMAKNMLRLVNDKEYADRLRSNGLLAARDRISNREVVEQYIRAYHECINTQK